MWLFSYKKYCMIQTQIHQIYCYKITQQDVSSASSSEAEGEPAIHSLPQKRCMLWVNTGVAPGMNDRAGHTEKDEFEIQETNADTFLVS